MGLNPVCVDRQISTFSSDFDGRVFLCLLEDRNNVRMPCGKSEDDAEC